MASENDGGSGSGCGQLRCLTVPAEAPLLFLSRRLLGDSSLRFLGHIPTFGFLAPVVRGIGLLFFTGFAGPSTPTFLILLFLYWARHLLCDHPAVFSTRGSPRSWAADRQRPPCHLQQNRGCNYKRRSKLHTACRTSRVLLLNGLAFPFPAAMFQYIGTKPRVGSALSYQVCGLQADSERARESAECSDK